jgi:hypothetical protein
MVRQFRLSTRLMAELTSHSTLLSASLAHTVMRAQLALVAAGAAPVAPSEPSSVALEQAADEGPLTLMAEDFMALVDPQAAWVQPVRASEALAKKASPNMCCFNQGDMDRESVSAASDSLVGRRARCC